MATIHRSELFILNTKKNNSEKKGVEEVKLKQIERLKKNNKLSYRTRADGRIEIRFYKNNKAKSVYGWTQEEVIQKFKNWKPKVRKITKQENNKNNMIFEEWYNIWIKKYKKGNVADSTLKSYHYTFKKHILPKTANIYIGKITTNNIQEILNLLNHIPRQKTIVFNNLNQCMKKAKQLKLIKENPCDFVEFKKVKQIKHGKALTIKQQEKFEKYIEKIKHPMKNLFLVLLNTGMRRAEILNLRRSNINRLESKIYIAGTKTKLSNRTIMTTKSVINLIPNTEIPFEYKLNAPTKEFKNIARKLNFPDELTLHSLRHTFATRCIEKGVNIKVIQKWLGHSSLKMTADTYSHVHIELEKKELEKLK